MNPRPSAARRRAGRPVDAIVVGAGHSGLAMSHCLAKQAVDHVVLERGEIANSWRTERWDSLQLLTPNWQSRLPGYGYAGDEPDDFMTMAEVIDFIDDYARFTSAPARTHTRVLEVTADGDGFAVVTDRETWRTRAVVVASGAFAVASVPRVGAGLPGSVRQITSQEYRNPESLEPGRVLVVGASATGVQLATELHNSGRPVTLAVGEHIRMPRTYRGRDVLWWMEKSGILDQHYAEADDIHRARRVPSPQLIGSRDRQTLDLNALTAAGVEIVGRLVGMRDDKAQFSGSLANHCAMADLKLGRLLNTFDDWATDAGLDASLDAPTRPEPTRITGRPRIAIDLDREKYATVVWATGLRPDYSWLNLPTFDRKGRLMHEGGVAKAPGIYVLGLPYLRRRKSSYIHGAEDDARDLSAHLVAYLRELSAADWGKALPGKPLASLNTRSAPPKAQPAELQPAISAPARDSATTR